MNLKAVRSTLVTVILLAIGCSGGGGLGGACSGGGGCGGCSSGCMAPIPGGFPAAKRIDNAVAAQLTPQALTFLQSNLQNLVQSLLGSSGIQVGCMPNIFSDDITVAGIDLGTIGASVCCPATSGQCGVGIGFGNLTVDPETAGDGSVNVNVTLPLQINTQTIPVTASADPFGLGTISATCDISYNQSSPVNVTATLNLKVDPTWGNILAANVANLNVASLINNTDLSISGGGGSCSITHPGNCVTDAVCGLAGDIISSGLLSSTISGLITPTINSDVQGAVDSFRCQACDTTQWPGSGCPTPSSGTAPSCDQSTNLCYINKDLSTPASDTCAPAMLGLQGRVNLGATLASFGGSPDTTMDVYAVAGGANVNSHASTYVDPPSPNGGIVLGLMGGTDAPNPSMCVPVQAAPTLAAVTPINFESAASEAGVPAVGSYDAAFSISSEFLNKALYDAYSSGVICLNVGSSLSSLIATGTFTTFLGSLGYLGHNESRPMLVALRPKNAPTVTIGLGTTTTTNGMTTIDKPLMTIGMVDLQIDFYAFFEERYVRVFTLQVPNFSLPLALDFNNGGIQPVLGSLSDALTGLQQINCKMMDGTDCKFFDSANGMNMGLTAILGLLPISSLIPTISLPSFDGISVNIDSARGAVAASQADVYEQMVLFASLSNAPQSAPRTQPRVQVAQSHLPTLADVLSKKDFPYVVLQAGADNGSGNYEYAYRVDGNLWSFWNHTNRLEIHSPVFFLEGRHTIDVISRVAGQPGTESITPASVQFVVDYAPPRVQLNVDAASGQLTTTAQDNVWGSNLSYQYSIDGGSWSSPTKSPQAFNLQDLVSNRSVDVQVTDGSGHISTASWGASPRLAEAAAATLRSQGLVQQ